MVESSPSSSSFSQRCRLRWLYESPSPSASVGVGGDEGVAGVEGVAQGLSSPPSGLNSPPLSLMSKKGDWDRPGKESITPAEGREPERRALWGRGARLSSPLLPSKMGFMLPREEPSDDPRTFLKNCSES